MQSWEQSLLGQDLTLKVPSLGTPWDCSPSPALLLWPWASDGGIFSPERCCTNEEGSSENLAKSSVDNPHPKKGLENWKGEAECQVLLWPCVGTYHCPESESQARQESQKANSFIPDVQKEQAPKTPQHLLDSIKLFPVIRSG